MAIFAYIIIILAATLSVVNAALVSGKWFDRIFVVFFENTNYTDAIASPYFKSLVEKNNSVLMSNYFGVAHPSQPNYIASIYGDTAGITDDELYDIDGINLMDLLEAKGVSWKGYFQQYPGNCFTGMKTDGAAYVREHNPFISMKNISNNSTRCANIVNADQFEVDLASNDLPQFVFYVPDRFNDAHETNLTHATSWFQSWFDDKLQNVNFTTNTLSLVVFDESHGYGVNHIYASLIGSPVTSGANEDTTNYTHYSFTKTVEENWSLGNLGRNDVSAEPFSKFLRVNDIKNTTSTLSTSSVESVHFNVTSLNVFIVFWLVVYTLSINN